MIMDIATFETAGFGEGNLTPEFKAATIKQLEKLGNDPAFREICASLSANVHLTLSERQYAMSYMIPALLYLIVSPRGRSRAYAMLDDGINRPQSSPALLRNYYEVTYRDQPYYYEDWCARNSNTLHNFEYYRDNGKSNAPLYIRTAIDSIALNILSNGFTNNRKSLVPIISETLKALMVFTTPTSELH